jgi:hypothetical protein
MLLQLQGFAPNLAGLRHITQAFAEFLITQFPSGVAAKAEFLAPLRLKNWLR